MKTRFNTYDIVCMVTELQRLIGMRVNQVYDIDNRTYVIRLQRSEEKSVLLLESGNRFHTTLFEWPKNVAPSGFTMKLRKHLKNKRVEKLSQLGIDRIVDLQFGSGEAAYHVILELYDRGNIVLTDCEWTILNVLRPHVEGDKVRFAVKEKYPLDRAKTDHTPPGVDALKQIFANSKPGENLKKILNPNLEYGSSVIDHVLVENGLSGTMKVTQDPQKGFHVDTHMDQLVAALQLAERLLEGAMTEVAKGYIIQKKEERPNPDGGGPTFLLTNLEFHPLLYSQHKNQPHTEYETFDRAVDEFFSALEGQKIDLKTIQVEREAMKKLQNVRKDHEKRVTELEKVQVEDKKAAELITRNQQLVEQCRLAIQTAIANQMSWDDIKLLLKTAQDNKDPIASCIKQLKLATNHISLALSDPYAESDEDERLPTMVVDIDLSLTAYGNATRYYDQKRNAAKKQQKTLESAGKALKSAERKTKQTLKEAHTISNISKARKTYWFEKFFWFISSDNYLVIAGRDQQQNELLVKRYLRATDLYVHAEVAGASSVVIKNPGGGPVPPRTLAEAGQAAVAYSVAWEAKVLTRAWWVHAHQVSKSAPTGEYLTTGSFMIRGKKSYLVPEQLNFGFSFMFRLEDSCIENHKDERKAIALDDMSVTSSAQEDEQEIIVSDDDDEPSDKEDTNSKTLDTITEETKQLDISEEKTETQNSKKETNKHKTDTREHKTDNNKHKTDTNKPETDTKEHKADTQIDESEHDSQRDEESEQITEVSEDRKEGGDDVTAGIEEDSDSEDSGSEAFPDTHIKVDHGTGQVITESRTRTVSELSDRSESTVPSFPSLPKKGKKPTNKSAKEQKRREEKRKEEKQEIKRGQKSKLKKIREKYKDQDEEDRQMRMELLRAAQAINEEKRAQKKKDSKGGKSKAAVKMAKIPAPAPIILEVDSEEEVEPDQEGEQQAPDADTEMLSQLTGSPLPNDELLFAVPVVAPYSALHNYKFKVKLTPGTSKRGKAAKTAVQVFLKTASPREKDLLKAVKEENIARNFPGKVKLSAPQLHKLRK